MQIGNSLGRYEEVYGKSKAGTKNEVEKEAFQNEITESGSTTILSYYRKLCAEFPDISFRLEDREKALREQYASGYEGSSHQVGNNFSQPGKCSIEIDKVVIEKMIKDKEYAESVRGSIRNIQSDYGIYESHRKEEGMLYMAVELFEEKNKLTHAIGFANTPFHTAEEAKRFRETGEMADGTVISKKVKEVSDEMQEAYFRMVEESRRRMDELWDQMSGQKLKEGDQV